MSPHVLSGRTTIGNEGMVGLPAFLGAGTSPLTTFAQVEGEALRLAAATLRELAGPGSRLHDRLQRYTQALFILTAQSVACNRLHPVEARCGRWLLWWGADQGAAPGPRRWLLVRVRRGNGGAVICP